MTLTVQAGLALALWGACIMSHVQAIFIDRCGANEFERLYDRAHYMVMDFRNPDVHRDWTRYKRDFADATKFEEPTFIVWRFPNGETYNKLWFVINELNAEGVIKEQNQLKYEYSTDAKTWKPASPNPSILLADALSPDGSVLRRNVTISLPEQARYFKMTWTSCAWDPATNRATCIHYYFPSVNHFCAANTENGEDANLSTCYPEGMEVNPKAEDPTPKYCGTLLVNNFWDDTIFGVSKNVLGGYSASDGTMTRKGHHVPKMGIGQGEVYMNVTEGSSYWVEGLTPGNECVDISSYTHLRVDITARDKFAMDVHIEQGADGACSGGDKIVSVATDTSKYTQFTKLAKRSIVIPFADFDPPLDMKHARRILFQNFRNPSQQWVYMDNVAFVGGNFQRPVAAAPSGGDISPDGNPSMAFDLSCTKVQGYQKPVIKFAAKASKPGTAFKVEVVTAEDPDCSGDLNSSSTDSSSLFQFPLDELEYDHQFAIPITGDSSIKVARVVISDVRSPDARVFISGMRIGTGECEEPVDPLRPNYAPVPYPIDYPQNIYEVWPAPTSQKWANQAGSDKDDDHINVWNRFDLGVGHVPVKPGSNRSTTAKSTGKGGKAISGGSSMQLVGSILFSISFPLVVSVCGVTFAT